LDANVTSNNLGIALQQVGALRKDVSLVEEAVTVLEEAVEIYRQRGNDSKQVDAVKNLIPALLALGRGDDAAARLAFAFAYYNANDESTRSAELMGLVKSLMDNA
jgi:tetratricopeptide (TPR) repeat protein